MLQAGSSRTDLVFTGWLHVQINVRIVVFMHLALLSTEQLYLYVLAL